MTARHPSRQSSSLPDICLRCLRQRALTTPFLHLGLCLFPNNFTPKNVRGPEKPSFRTPSSHPHTV